MAGPPCGNNPRHQLTPGDTEAVADFRAYLAARAQEQYMSMNDRPAALDGLLGYVADSLPDEGEATARARAALAPLEAKLREHKAQERAGIRSATLREAIDVAREEGNRLEELASIATARGARSVAYLLRKLLVKEQPPVGQPTPAESTSLDRTPLARSVRYIVRGAPDVPDEYNATRTITPTEVTFTYPAVPDAQLGRVHAYVKGWWKQDGARVHAEAVGRHFTGDLADWPQWLAAEARRHDPAAAERDEQEAQAHLDQLADLRPPMDLIRDAANYLSALHGSVGRHDNLAANLNCAGCELLDRLRAEQRRQPRPVDGAS
ncbi:hypothetical protein [Streptomyces sp. SAS_272]|uniref:hypothetical protein n=1 Tax=Streptomyces sp. SAS_272 TaxID=3412747 RepID=UPI00403D3D05